MRNDNERNLLDTQLIQLSHIFKEKFIVKIIDNKIIQRNITDFVYEDRTQYKIIIEIKDKSIAFKNGKLPDVCVIKGWFNKQKNTYYIGLRM